MPATSPNAKEHVLVAFGTAVRNARKDVGISQEELAHLSGIDRSYLGAIERGDQNTGLIHISKIASALGIKVAELMMRADL
ncbi:MAG: helix-turn-helix domain-containing protein [Burkholderiales bacterium]